MNIPRPISHPYLFPGSFILSFLFLWLCLTLIGWHEHWLAHPQRSIEQEENQFLEAQIYKVPENPHLVDETPRRIKAAPRAQEKILSKVPSQGKAAVAETGTPKEEENQTQAGTALPATHGPVAIYAPPPLLPAYLQSREIHTSVVIDFFVNSQGHASPRLVGSSGDDELDAIALNAVKAWQFRPGEMDHKAVDAKVRLRIVFKVE